MTLSLSGLHYSGWFDPPSYFFLPFIIELFGRSNKHADWLLNAISKHQCVQGAGQAAYSHHMSLWRQRISMVLQRSVSEEVISAYTEAVPLWVNGVEQPRDFAAHSRLRLLQIPHASSIAIT